MKKLALLLLCLANPVSEEGQDLTPNWAVSQGWLDNGRGDGAAQLSLKPSVAANQQH